MKWLCEICGRSRDDADISVLSHDLSEKHGLPFGTMTRNVKYCTDSAECSAAAAERPDDNGGIRRRAAK